MTTLVQARRTLRTKAIAKVHEASVCSTVEGQEPKQAPKRSGIHGAVVLGAGQTSPENSGSASTAWRQVVLIRLQIALPLRDTTASARIEDQMADASATIVDAFHDDIDLAGDGTIEFDPLGSAGLLATTEAGYVDQDGTKFRIEDISLPFILWDIWDQTR